MLSATRVFSADIADTDAPVVIGTNYPTGIQPVEGFIDEAAIFSVALEEEDINTIMIEGPGSGSRYTRRRTFRQIGVDLGRDKSQ